MTTKGLLEAHAEVWKLGIRNPFLQGVREGSLAKASMAHWLRQFRITDEAVFVAFARVLSKAPASHRPELIEGLGQTDATMRWVDARLARMRAPAMDVHPVSRAYMDFLAAASIGPYVVGVTALWASLQAVLDDWTWAKKCAPEFRPYAARWTSPKFARTVKGLRRAADLALREASPGDRKAAVAAFEQVSRYEVDFWIMALEREAA